MSITAASPRGPTRRAPAQGAGIVDPFAGAPTWDAAWASALERAELDAAEVEALLARIHAEPDHSPEPPAPWSPPPRLGPLPASLAVRAEAVLKRHQRLAEDLTVAITENRRHRRALESLRPREAAAPVYIDTEV